MNSFIADKNTYFSMISNMIYFDPSEYDDSEDYWSDLNVFIVFSQINHVRSRTIINYCSYQNSITISLYLMTHTQPSFSINAMIYSSK